MDTGIVFEGDYPDIDHWETGLLSLDLALGSKGKPGIPMRTIYEISGPTHVGKSTLGYFMATRVPHSDLVICDLEGLDKDYLQECLQSANWTGKVKLIPITGKKKSELRSHGEMLQEAVQIFMYDPKYNVGLWDSVGATIPMVESEGDFEEAFMGRRAKLVGQVIRRITTALMFKEQPSIFITINHQQAVLGGYGNTTPGGTTHKFLSACRISLWEKEVLKIKDTVVGYLLEGTVNKNRYGGKGRKFSFVNLSGMGVNPDLSVVFDCFRYGLATRGATVKIGKESIGYISKLYEYARERKHDKFEPFYEVLNDYRLSGIVPTQDTDDSTDVSDGEAREVDSELEPAAVDE